MRHFSSTVLGHGAEQLFHKITFIAVSELDQVHFTLSFASANSEASEVEVRDSFTVDVLAIQCE
jgi:hypothetical protein